MSALQQHDPIITEAIRRTPTEPVDLDPELRAKHTADGAGDLSDEPVPRAMLQELGRLAGLLRMSAISADDVAELLERKACLPEQAVGLRELVERIVGCLRPRIIVGGRS